jgi:hypothetical protein
MRKLISCCFATTALLALTLTAPAAPGSAMARAAGLHSALGAFGAFGAGPVILVADENKAVDEKKAANAKTNTKSH